MQSNQLTSISESVLNSKQFQGGLILEGGEVERESITYNDDNTVNFIIISNDGNDFDFNNFVDNLNELVNQRERV